MADEPGTAPTTDTPPGDAGTQDKTFTQADLDRVVQERLQRERGKFADYDDLKAKASRLDELETANQTELEKLTGKVTTLGDENKGLKGENLRLRVALDKDLPAEFIDRLKGTTAEELAADADKLLELVKKPGDGDPPPPDFDGGARETAPAAQSPEHAHDAFIAQLISGKSP